MEVLEARMGREQVGSLGCAAKDDNLLGTQQLSARK